MPATPERKVERRGATTPLPIYGVDALVRRAPALQKTRAALAAAPGGS
jgi:hypothetical protein